MTQNESDVPRGPRVTVRRQPHRIKVHRPSELLNVHLLRYALDHEKVIAAQDYCNSNKLGVVAFGNTIRIRTIKASVAKIPKMLTVGFNLQTN